jgi:hypothetical protein
VTFLTTLVGLAVICCMLAVAIQHGVLTWIAARGGDPSSTVGTTTTVDGSSSELPHSPTILVQAELEDAELWLEGIAVVLCWCLAVGFCIKKRLKQRRWMGQAKDIKSMDEEATLLPSLSPPSVPMEGPESDQQDFPEESILLSHGTGCDAVGESTVLASVKPDKTKINTTIARQPCTVVSLTALGFLDEISYFPTLILGGILTGWELVLGTFLAGLFMLAIQAFLASQCKPLLDCLDKHVPLHGVIAIFATILTVNWIWDMIDTGGS